MESVRYVLLDIEGTICPISFVKDTLVGGSTILFLVARIRKGQPLSFYIIR